MRGTSTQQPPAGALRLQADPEPVAVQPVRLPSTDGFSTWNGKRLPLLEAFKQKFQLARTAPEGWMKTTSIASITALINQTEPADRAAERLLLEYDQNIVRHTQRLNERRIARGEEPIVWKYFQYLSLLFTEIYLDRYFRDPAALAGIDQRADRALQRRQARAGQGAAAGWQRRCSAQLNKLAFWSATGSGKTLMMHANILQYQHYLESTAAAASSTASSC